MNVDERPRTVAELVKKFDVVGENGRARDGRLTTDDVCGEEVGSLRPAEEKFANAVMSLPGRERALLFQAAGGRQISMTAAAATLMRDHAIIFADWSAESGGGKPSVPLFHFGYDVPGEPSVRATKVCELVEQMKALPHHDQAMFRSIAKLLVPEDQVERFGAALWRYESGRLTAPKKEHPPAPELVPLPKSELALGFKLMGGMAAVLLGAAAFPDAAVLVLQGVTYGLLGLGGTALADHLLHPAKEP